MTASTVLRVPLDANESALLIARKDYKVQAVDRTSSAVRWSIAFSEIHHLDTSIAKTPFAVMQYIKEKDTSVAYPHKKSYLTTGEDNSLHARDPATGDNKWSVSFTSAPVIAYLLDSAGHSTMALDPSLSHDASSAPDEFWARKNQRKLSKVLVRSFATGERYVLPIPAESSDRLSSEEEQGNGVPPADTARYQCMVGML